MVLALFSFSGCKSLTMTQEELRQADIKRIIEQTPNIGECADVALNLRSFIWGQDEQFYLPTLAVYNENNVTKLTSDLILAEDFVNKVDPHINNWLELNCDDGSMSYDLYRVIQYKTGNDYMGAGIANIKILTSKGKDMKKTISSYQTRIEYLNSDEYKKRREMESNNRINLGIHALKRSGYVDDISPSSAKDTGPRYARCYYMSEFLGFTDTHFVTLALKTMDKAYFKRQLDFVNTYLSDVTPVTEEKRLDKAGSYFRKYCR